MNPSDRPVISLTIEHVTAWGQLQTASASASIPHAPMHAQCPGQRPAFHSEEVEVEAVAFGLEGTGRLAAIDWQTDSRDEAGVTREQEQRRLCHLV